MHPSLRDRLPRLLAFMAAALVILLALREIRATRDYGPYLAMDALFARRQAVSPAALGHYGAQLDGDLKTCRSDIVDAVISVSQRHVDQQFAEGGAAARLIAMQRMESVVRGALECSPTDGDLWARLAMLRWVLGGGAGEQLALMELSQSYAPADLAVIRRRLRHWSEVTRPMAVLGDRLVRADLRTVLLYAPEREAIRTIHRLPQHLRGLVEQEALIVPASRMTALRDAGLSIGVK